MNSSWLCVDANLVIRLVADPKDEAEAAAIKRVFGDRAGQVPVITTTPNVGNCNAGAGAVSVVVAAQALATQTLPARLNTASADGLDAAACPSRSAEL